MSNCTFLYGDFLPVDERNYPNFRVLDSIQNISFELIDLGECIIEGRVKCRFDIILLFIDRL